VPLDALPTDDNAPLSVAAEAERMLDRNLLATAEARLEVALAVQDVARLRANIADQQHRAATAAFIGLVDAATRGEEVEREQVIAARRAEADAADWATFCATTARAAAGPIEDARKAISEAKHAAWGAIAQHGIRLRISAAMKADRVAAIAASAGWGGTHEARTAVEEKRRKAVNAIEPEWQRGSDFVNLAARSGWRLKAAVSVAVPEWPSREKWEREFWMMPATEEEQDAA
jgi:hypothetical protein